MVGRAIYPSLSSSLKTSEWNTSSCMSINEFVIYERHCCVRMHLKTCNYRGQVFLTDIYEVLFIAVAHLVNKSYFISGVQKND